MKTIPLTQGQYAIVDDADYQKLSLWKWHAVLKKTGFYASRQIELPRVGTRRRRLSIYMHRYLMGFPAGDVFEVHHKNHQPLDNRKENLEVMSAKIHTRLRRKGENYGGQKTTSRYIGVSWWKQSQKWIAQLQKKDGARIFLARFDSEFEAAVAFDTQSRKVNGNFAVLNYQVR